MTATAERAAPPVFAYRIADAWESIVKQAIQNAAAGRIGWDELEATAKRWTDWADREGGR